MCCTINIISLNGVKLEIEQDIGNNVEFPLFVLLLTVMSSTMDPCILTTVDLLLLLIELIDGAGDGAGGDITSPESMQTNTNAAIALRVHLHP